MDWDNVIADRELLLTNHINYGRSATAEGSNMDTANTPRGDTAELEKIRKTDNTLKEGDKPGINQEPKPLVLGEDGLPVDWNGGE